MSKASPIDYQARPSGPGISLRDLPRALGWAIYLGMSWTWCIGMFLPVLLVRDYGIWGFVVFAVPNVIGAAAMGWVIASSQNSQLITAAHGTACRWFSIVTLAFHGFFALAIVGNLWDALGPLFAFNVFVGFAILIDWRERYAVPVSIVVAAISVLMFAMALCVPAASRPPAQSFNDIDVGTLAMLLLTCVFGFALCPYLDLTFHHARQSAQPEPQAARFAFTVGFGIFFLVMLLFSLLYASALRDAVIYRGDSPPPPTGLLYWFVFVHMIVQIGFTCAIHVKAVGARQGSSILLALLVMAGVIVPMRLLNGRAGLSGIELGYRMFMGFYALVFPAYVWLCMIPGRGRVAPSQRQLIVLAISVLIAAPMFWMGFIERRMFWLLPGLAIVLLARLLVPRRDYAHAAAL